MKEKQATYRETLSFALHYWRRRPRMGVLLLVLLTAATMTDAFLPVYMGRIVDALVNHTHDDPKALAAALHYLLIFVVLGVAFNVLRSLANACWNWFAVHNLHDIVRDATARVQRFSADWHANAFAGGTVRKITRGMWAFDMFEDTLFTGLLPAAIIMVGMTIILYLRLPAVGIFTAVTAIIYCGVNAIIALKILRPRFQASAAADTKIGARLADMITGNATVKSFAAEGREDSAFHEITNEWHGISYRAWQTAEAINLVRGLLRTLMMTGMVGIAVWMWKNGQATPGDIVFSLTSFFVISGYMRDVGQQVAHLQRSASEMEDVVAFRLYQDEMHDRPGAKPFVPGAGEIIFDHVDFAYKNNTPLYAGFSIRIAPGEHIALVGPSGAGKSTFAKLVQRLYEVQGGAIRIDGQDINAVTQESLRQAIALVPQEPILFHRSLAENIAYGRPGATMDEIIAAARKSYAHEFIAALPQGYDTLVGERGVKLSGGERQRVAIARAILADTPVLLLDEATSSLDSVSEHYIQKALAELVKGRTTVTIAHRLATIRSADRILVFDGGRVVEQGTHAELIARPESHYRKLFEMQALDLIGDFMTQDRAAE